MLASASSRVRPCEMQPGISGRSATGKLSSPGRRITGRSRTGRMASGIVTFTRTAFDAASGAETRNGTAPLLRGSLRIVSRRDGEDVRSAVPTANPDATVTFLAGVPNSPRILSGTQRAREARDSDRGRARVNFRPFASMLMSIVAASGWNDSRSDASFSSRPRVPFRHRRSRDRGPGRPPSASGRGDPEDEPRAPLAAGRRRYRDGPENPRGRSRCRSSGLAGETDPGRGLATDSPCPKLNAARMIPVSDLPVHVAAPEYVV